MRRRHCAMLEQKGKLRGEKQRHCALPIHTFKPTVGRIITGVILSKVQVLEHFFATGTQSSPSSNLQMQQLSHVCNVANAVIQSSSIINAVYQIIDVWSSSIEQSLGAIVSCVSCVTASFTFSFASCDKFKQFFPVF